ncbi:hypothetical protein [Allobaculum sp. JKK-2023]|uniref:hypothetical protein n=1 Tax=Allobaculum sp. JKK-2023 TaxID=3108943 RepID=UPI002B05A841|nr:hypothetical protein [Allobaculum sp. JKK-2023]
MVKTQIKRPAFHVHRRTLLLIAGIVWLIAGVNVARLGIIAYGQLYSINFLDILLSIVVFALFGFMFFKMSVKHHRRIHGYREIYRPIWHFFDLKSYVIMAIMMTGGIWLRNSGLVSTIFIAVFYTGLGCALGAAGLFFLVLYAYWKE